ncbi:hypothetical protein QOZ80_2AG0133800 [Eleusine coracana subsp. coracana]|nr:hypothetical protein QOZ80_2AG0133800 [Eleusine coracana subsp. coracana]
MASLLKRAAYDASAASRAARSAAFAASCAARSAAARSAAGATAADPSQEHRSGFGYEARDAAPHDNGVSFPGNEPHKPTKISFLATEKELESDEAMWALYDRWRKRYNQERDLDELSRRFNEFKKTAHYVHRINNSNLPYKLELNQFSDGKLAEACFPPPGVLARTALGIISGDSSCWEQDGRSPEKNQPEYA